MNGYFQLITGEKGTLIKLFPETDGGEPLDLNEIMEYLKLKNVLYNQKLLKDGFDKHEEVIVPLCQEQHYPEQEMCVIKVSDDELHATIRFYAPSDKGMVMERAEIMNDIAYNKIVYGVKTEVIDQFLANREYCKTYELAEGLPAKSGKDAQIEYFFNTDPHAKPTLNEDGSVDFFNLNNMNRCNKGDVLARLHPELKGEPGTTVLGGNITPPTFERKVLKFGKNVAINEEKTELTAEVDGHILFTDETVRVSDEYEVKCVDTGTGNIDFEGSVYVKENICENFTVKAKGNVFVGGVVEGAYVEAGGDIIISRGMNGKDKGKLKAGGNIIAKFLENTTATAVGYVEAESIMHSQVEAGDEVVVTGRKAFIAGSVVSAKSRITARTLGSPMGIATTLEVGVEMESKQRLTELQKEVAELQGVIKQVEPTVKNAIEKMKQGVKLAPDQMAQVQKLAALYNDKKALLEKNLKEMEELSGKLEAVAEACVIAEDTAYPGTKIVIADSSLTIKEKYQYTRFKRVRGDIKGEAI